jgi:2-polyprenyl-6-methoxyphenol hydroxylase-like FAD-dependent oxidoreductase
MRTTPRGTILISGASIAGPALAFWLHHYGFEVTIVEKAGALRGGGYPIDIRGTALGVVERMGVLPRLRSAHVDCRQFTFVDTDGSTITRLAPNLVLGGVDGRDLEVRRGDLAKILYDLIRDDVEFLFNDSIAALDDHAGGVDVTFESGVRRTFDLVIGADGLHSQVRRLVFGREERFHRYIGDCFAGFTMRNDFGLSHEGVVWAAPGRRAALYAVGGGEGDSGDSLFGFLSFSHPEPPFDAFRDPAAQRDLVASVFRHDRWEIPRMVSAMRAADDLFFDVVSQIHLPRWSAGRVALVGDAAYAPSFLTGQGSSIALVGAYVLAGELATQPDSATAFTAYEQDIREFVRLNQALVDTGNARPDTAEALAQRNEMLRGLTTIPSGAGKPEYTAYVLPDFAGAAQMIS